MVDRLGQYTVDRKLAEGGMGSVYLGTAADGRQVVLKVPHAQDRESALALVDEARAGMRLKHPGIVETLDCFTDKGVSVLVVAYIDGVSLFGLRKRAGALPAAAVAVVGADLASALDAIHTAVDERGRPLSMIHRDVSPNNVLVDTAGQVRLIDLGIVRSAERTQKATMQGMVKGTLRYLAPEILEGADHSPSSDLWALGVTLYEAALGRYAMPGDDMDTVRAVMDGSFFRAVHQTGLDPNLVEALAVLIARPDDRLRNARAASAVLGRLASKLSGGRPALATAARGQAQAAPPPELTEVTSRNAVGPETTAPTLLSSRGDIDSVFTSSVGRASLPTLQIPRVDPPPAAAQPPPSTAPAPVDMETAPTMQMPAVSTFETAATIQMGAWQPPAGSGPVVAPPKGVSMADAATAPTQIALPQVELPSDPSSAPTMVLPQADVEPAPSPPTSTEPPSAPKPQIQKPHRPPTQPAPSLILPIVVVDEDGEEIP